VTIRHIFQCHTQLTIVRFSLVTFTGYYNDHHFHYGYHIYAAAAVAHFDGDWGRTHFEEVLLLIRDVANPSSDDAFFPKFRHKDWYQGSSWASGVTQPTFANGMNQESSSEAIAAYEAVALFGQEMVRWFFTLA
jgi:endo-1,3(4)-beta-glucanase